MDLLDYEEGTLVPHLTLWQRIKARFIGGVPQCTYTMIGKECHAMLHLKREIHALSPMSMQALQEVYYSHCRRY